MNKCGKCRYFRMVKILYAKNGNIENCFGVCEKSRSEDLIEGDDPACRDYLEAKEDPLYN